MINKKWFTVADILKETACLLSDDSIQNNAELEVILKGTQPVYFMHIILQEAVQ